MERRHCIQFRSLPRSGVDCPFLAGCHLMPRACAARTSEGSDRQHTDPYRPFERAARGDHGGCHRRKGAMDYELEEAEIARAMIGHAKRVNVVADSSKLGRTALFSVSSLKGIDRLVASAAPDGRIAQALLAAQAEVLVP
jgi:DeoR C terminal sensor domain